MPTLQTKKPRRKTGLSESEGLSASYDTYVATVELAFDFKLQYAIGLGEQSVILAHTYVFARVELGAALANDDVASNDALTTIHFHAKSFGF